MFVKSHLALELGFSKQVNSPYRVSQLMQVCLVDFQETVLPPRGKKKLLVDFDSLQSEIQLASSYSFSTLANSLLHRP